MDSFEYEKPTEEIARIVLESHSEGVYIFLFEKICPGTPPFADYLQDDIEMAKRSCARKFQTTEGGWKCISRTAIRDGVLE